jgi:hypothetical protein
MSKLEPGDLAWVRPRGETTYVVGLYSEQDGDPDPYGYFTFFGTEWSVNADEVEVLAPAKVVLHSTPTRGEVFKEAADFIKGWESKNPLGADYYVHLGMGQAGDMLTAKAAELLLEEP